MSGICSEGNEHEWANAMPSTVTSAAHAPATCHNHAGIPLPTTFSTVAAIFAASTAACSARATDGECAAADNACSMACKGPPQCAQRDSVPVLWWEQYWQTRLDIAALNAR